MYGKIDIKYYCNSIVNFSILRKSMTTISCLVTNFLHNMLLCIQELKHIHTGLEQWRVSKWWQNCMCLCLNSSSGWMKSPVKCGPLYYYMIWAPVFLEYTSHCVSFNLKHIELQPQESINILFHFTANLSQTLWLHFYFIQKTKEDWTCEDKR